MPMASVGSITHWINQLKSGDHDAAQQLWERYCQRLIGLARKKLQGRPPRGADEEDVTLSAFDSLCRAAGRDRFSQLHDRDDLWQLLVLIAERKVSKLVKHERRLKRGGGRVLDEAALAGRADSSEVPAGIERVMDCEPTPELAAQVAEEYERLLDRLGDDELRTIALWKMEGYTEDEMAAKLGCVPRTVRRKLRRIRALWAKEIEP